LWGCIGDLRPAYHTLPLQFITRSRQDMSRETLPPTDEIGNTIRCFADELACATP
jgi:hypothetical protein